MSPDANTFHFEVHFPFHRFLVNGILIYTTCNDSNNEEVNRSKTNKDIMIH